MWDLLCFFLVPFYYVLSFRCPWCERGLPQLCTRVLLLYRYIACLMMSVKLHSFIISRAHWTCSQAKVSRLVFHDSQFSNRGHLKHLVFAFNDSNSYLSLRFKDFNYFVLRRLNWNTRCVQLLFDESLMAGDTVISCQLITNLNRSVVRIFLFWWD